MRKPIHIALDFDKTIAYHESEWGISRIGHPIPSMICRVKRWVELGYKITIFTARLSHNPFTNFFQRRRIAKFLKENGLPVFPMTAKKMGYFSHIVDDRAVGVVSNCGQFYFRHPELDTNLSRR